MHILFHGNIIIHRIISLKSYKIAFKSPFLSRFILRHLLTSSPISSRLPSETDSCFDITRFIPEKPRMTRLHSSKTQNNALHSSKTQNNALHSSKTQNNTLHSYSDNSLQGYTRRKSPFLFQVENMIRATISINSRDFDTRDA